MSPAAPPNQSHLWLGAATFAAKAHRMHTRKDGVTPYVAHVFRVAMIVRHDFRCDDDEAIAAAILHDTIEDTPTDYDDIADEFGRPVADMVAALTKNMILREDVRERDYDERLARGPWQARLVKLADAYDNTCDSKDLGGESSAERLSRAIARSERAIALAQADAGERPAVARAIRAVRDLIEASRKAR